VNQIVVFLAEHKPLVHQQAEYFRDQMCPNFGNKEDENVNDLVMVLTGDVGIDKYSQDRGARSKWLMWMQKRKVQNTDRQEH
jgi:hypothetical protein